ncbi:MAG TPA: L,D-transpeptidase family protein [Verrucomicrobiae bacterium]|nr:L,D-transpeptidase family protein [Verrucomicrobiae bacterium]
MKSWISLALLTMWLAGCNRAPTTSSSDVPKESPPAPKAAIAVPPAAMTALADDELAKALALKHEGKFADARALLQQLAATTNASDQVYATLGEIDALVLFSPTPAPEKVDYTVEAGDSLAKIAKKFGTTIELIKQSNNLSRDMIRVGDRLRIYQGKFAVEVSKTENTLTLTDDGKFFKRYRVGTGQFSKTPVGEFKITSKLEDPPWYRPDGKTIPFGDPENILGKYWLGINVPGYGIHGTWETNSIGRQSSAGCVRLLNDDVGELYVILPIGTPVTIHN